MGRSLAGEVPADSSTHRSIRDIEALDTNVKQRIGKTLLRTNPIRFATPNPLSNRSWVQYRFRIGDYRVVFDIARGDEIVILRVGHLASPSDCFAIDLPGRVIEPGRGPSNSL